MPSDRTPRRPPAPPSRSIAPSTPRNLPNLSQPDQGPANEPRRYRAGSVPEQPRTEPAHNRDPQLTVGPGSVRRDSQSDPSASDEVRRRLARLPAELPTASPPDLHERVRTTWEHLSATRQSSEPDQATGPGVNPELQGEPDSPAAPDQRPAPTGASGPNVPSAADDDPDQPDPDFLWRSTSRERDTNPSLPEVSRRDRHGPWDGGPGGPGTPGLGP
jgi:hypothetical protein